MLRIIFVFAFLLFAGSISCKPSVSRCACENQRINQAILDWQKSLSTKASGCLNDFSVSKKVKYVEWENIFSPDFANPDRCIDSNCCRFEAICQDTVRQFQFQSGLIMEKGESTELYWLLDDFDKTKNGLSPGMSREAVKKVLGSPEHNEDNCIWSWGKEENADSYGPLLFFMNDSLYMIHYRVNFCNPD